MKNKVIWFGVFAVIFLITSVVVQFFKDGTIDPVRLLASAGGIAIAFLLL